MNFATFIFLTIICICKFYMNFATFIFLTTICICKFYNITP